MMKNKTDEPFKGKTFVFTGEMKMSRDEAKSKVVLLGGRCTIMPSSKTTHMVVGDEPGPSKMKKANALGIQIVKEEEFVRMVEEAINGLNDSCLVNICSDDVSSDEVIERGMCRSGYMKEIRDTGDIRDIKDIRDAGDIRDTGDIRDIRDIRDTGDTRDTGNKNISGIEKYKDKGDITRSTNINFTTNQCNTRNIPNIIPPQMLCEKYRPKTKDELVGNKNIINQLEDFMLGKTTHKAALLSGSPGIGKTTAVYVIARRHNLNLIEFNASDVRNKSEILKKVKGMIGSHCISREGVDRAILLMDEIDGMTSDRGGLLELNDMVKKTRIPIICICNDRNNLKIRSIAGNCLDLRFRKLEISQILPRVKEILSLERKHINDNILRDVILVSNGDVRYTLNIIQGLLLRDKVSYKQASEFVKKNAMKGIFDVVAEVFHRKSINEKTELYFEDYSMVPLFVAENYLKLNCSLVEMYRSSESISIGDIVDRKIRGSSQEYSLLPLHAFFSTIYPTRGKILNKRIDFPVWLGQNSKSRKNWRDLIEFLEHGGLHLNSSVEEFRKYIMSIFSCHYLLSLEDGKVDEAIKLLTNYDLLQEDIVVLISMIEESSNRYKRLKAALKASLTREYKKLKRSLPYNAENKKVLSVDEDPDTE